jgi:general secretion pathway protein I
MMIDKIVGWAKAAIRALTRVFDTLWPPCSPSRWWAHALRALSPPYGPGASRRAGFTLVEIIVALAILALSLNVILPTISDALWRTGEAEVQAEAASLARSLLVQAGSAMALKDGGAAGQFENGFRWRLEVTPYGSADQTMPVRAYKVVAAVFWGDAPHENSVALTTLRLGGNGAGR